MTGSSFSPGQGPPGPSLKLLPVSPKVCERQRRAEGRGAWVLDWEGNSGQPGLLKVILNLNVFLIPALTPMSPHSVPHTHCLQRLSPRGRAVLPGLYKLGDESYVHCWLLGELRAAGGSPTLLQKQVSNRVTFGRNTQDAADLRTLLVGNPRVRVVALIVPCLRNSAQT